MLIEKSKDPVEYLDFERSGWDAHIAGYNDTFGAVTRQTAEATLDAARVGRGAREEVTVLMTGLVEQIAGEKNK